MGEISASVVVLILGAVILAVAARAERKLNEAAREKRQSGKK
jgi:hypothetical protein